MVLALRWRGGDRSISLAIIGLTPALAIPLAAAAIGAWRSRSRVLQVVTAAVTALFLVWMNPASAVVGCRGDAPTSAITVYTANVLFDTGRASDIAASIVANEADVVLLQEVRWGFFDEFMADPRLDGYPHRQGRPDTSGNVIVSRWPLRDVSLDRFVVSAMLSVTVESPQGDFRISNIHTQAPTETQDVWAWKEQFTQLGQLDTSAPAVLGGDFNATADHRPFREVLGQGWTDVHEPKGCGFDATWPTGSHSPLPFPVYRLDHVLVTEHFEVLEVRLADPGGSDHVPVVAELRLGDEARLSSRAVDPTAG